MKTWKTAVIGPGEHRSKKAFPKPELSDREWSQSLPERTLNMLKNLEKSRWVTSYQQQHTGKDAEHGIGQQGVRECCYPSLASCTFLCQ